MGEIYNLFIGGGEPFLRADLGAILIAAVRHNHVVNVYVPTNGQHTRADRRRHRGNSEGMPEPSVSLELSSVDHTNPAEYDRIRGRDGAWKRMLRTAEAVEPLRKRFPNLILHTLTTVMKENQDSILEIHDELQRTFRPNGASYNYCRGNPLDPNQTEVDPAKYRSLVERQEEDYRAGRLIAKGPTAYGAANHLLDQRVRRTVERTVTEQRAQFSCVSGRLACVIYSDGRVTECETKETVLGNLREVDYDFEKLWFSRRATNAADDAANGCYCSHECGHYASAIYSVTEAAKIGAAAAFSK